MQVIEIINQSDGLTLRQRWAHVFTVLTAIMMMLFGLNLRARITNTTVFYESVQAGISASYPANWLLDTNGDYVFRVRNMSEADYKTTIQVSVLPIGSDAVERNITDNLTLQRISNLTRYSILSDQPYTMPDGEQGRSVVYSFVDSNPSPFLQDIPTVVIGIDVITISGGQAIIITYRAASNIFEEQFFLFETFLRRLQY